MNHDKYCTCKECCTGEIERLILAGMIEAAGVRDGKMTYQLTEAGRKWGKERNEGK